MPFVLLSCHSFFSLVLHLFCSIWHHVISAHLISPYLSQSHLSLFHVTSSSSKSTCHLFICLSTLHAHPVLLHLMSKQLIFHIIFLALASQSLSHSSKTLQHFFPCGQEKFICCSHLLSCHPSFSHLFSAHLKSSLFSSSQLLHSTPQCETSLKKWKWKMWNRSFRERLPSKSESGRCETEAFVRDFPQKVKVEDVKAKLSCETSLRKWKWKMWNRSFRGRLPSKSESGRCENEAFVGNGHPTAVTSICCDSHLLWHPFALTSHCFDSHLLWHPIALASICCDIHLLWHPTALTSHFFDSHLLWHPFALTSHHLLWHPFADFQRSVTRKYRRLSFPTALLTYYWERVGGSPLTTFF